MQILPKLTALVALWALAPASAAQIIGVSFKDDVPAKEYKNYTVKFRGEWILMGEIKSGFFMNQETGQSGYRTDRDNELFVLDPKNPGVSAYKFKKGEKVATGKKHVVGVPGKHIEGMFMIDRTQTLPGLAAEFAEAESDLDALRKARKAHTRNSPEWLQSGHGLVTRLEAHETWLLQFGFGRLAKKVRKEIEKERKLIAGSERAKQAKADQDSAKVVSTAEALLRVSEESYEGKHLFNTAESNHFRIHYLVEGHGRRKQHVSDEQALAALRFAEQVLDGFRADFIDPFGGEDFVDTIPEGILAEWFFGPESIETHDHYAKELYGVEVGTGIPEDQRSAGTSVRTGMPAREKFLWRLMGTDLEGVIVHQIGHLMTEFHYGSNKGAVRFDWLNEALGDHLSMKHRGVVSMTCLAFKENTYLKTEAKTGTKRSEGFGRRSLFDFIALSQAAPIRAVALKDLAEMGDADLAKGASFFRYLVRNEGKAGHLYLRAAAGFSRDPATLVDKWRQAAAKIYAVDPREALSGIESRWREFTKKAVEGM